MPRHPILFKDLGGPIKIKKINKFLFLGFIPPVLKSYQGPWLDTKDYLLFISFALNASKRAVRIFSILAPTIMWNIPEFYELQRVLVMYIAMECSKTFYLV